MSKQLAQYVLDLNKGNVDIKRCPIIDEFDLVCRFMYNGEPHIMQKNELCKLKEGAFGNEVFVSFIEDGTNELKNIEIAKELFTNYINNRQEDNKKRYYEETSKNNDCLHAIKDALDNPRNVSVEIPKELVQPIRIALHHQWHKVTDDNGKAISCRQEIADATYEALQMFERLESDLKAKTTPPPTYEYYEKIKGGFNLRTIFYSKEQVEEFAITAGRRIMSSSSVKDLCERVERDGKYTFIWDLNLSDIARIPSKYVGRKHRYLMQDTKRNEMLKIRECMQKYLDEVPCAYYRWEELGTDSKGALVYIYLDGSGDKLRGIIGSDGYPDILNDRGESVFDYKEEMELTDEDVDDIRGITTRDDSKSL